MAVVEVGSTVTFVFEFNSNYGTITESDYELQISDGGSGEYYINTDVTFTVIQPVAGTSDGSVSVNLIPASRGIMKACLYKTDTGKSIEIAKITAKAVDVVTTAQTLNAI